MLYDTVMQVFVSYIRNPQNPTLKSTFYGKQDLASTLLSNYSKGDQP